jgi:hypothetical protein
MKKLLPLLVAFLALAFIYNSASAAEMPPAADNGVLCLPGIYLLDNPECLPAGPAAYRTEMARQGIVLPLAPLPGRKPDFALTQVFTRYGLVRTLNAPVYGSVEDALKGNKKNAVRRIDSPFSYISYTDEAVVDGKRFYMVGPGEWMTANDVSRIGSVPLFQGLVFSRMPENAFGWVLSYLSNGPVLTKRTPGYENQDYTDHALNNLEVVQIYGETLVGEEAWYRVGPDEWVHQNVIARVLPNTTPPQGVTGDRWIEVNLFEQTISVYENRQLVFATLIASGLEPFWTRPGLFQIYSKIDTTPMRGSFEADRSDAYYLEDVPWTMYFDQARALHGAYWRANLGFPQSHGCVNLTVGDARWLFDWAVEGDWVYVWDPSGKTPVNPDQYTAGGA